MREFKVGDVVTAKVIDCNEYQIILNDGTNYKVICSSDELDKLIDLIGEEHIIEIKE